jgi:hypothetical protein
LFPLAVKVLAKETTLLLLPYFTFGSAKHKKGGTAWGHRPANRPMRDGLERWQCASARQRNCALPVPVNPEKMNIAFRAGTGGLHSAEN